MHVTKKGTRFGAMAIHADFREHFELFLKESDKIRHHAWHLVGGQEVEEVRDCTRLSTILGM